MEAEWGCDCTGCECAYDTPSPTKGSVLVPPTASPTVPPAASVGKAPTPSPVPESSQLTDQPTVAFSHQPSLASDYYYYYYYSTDTDDGSNVGDDDVAGSDDGGSSPSGCTSNDCYGMAGINDRGLDMKASLLFNTP